jgi:mono/diheme cytochrome c family protein
MTKLILVGWLLVIAHVAVAQDMGPRNFTPEQTKTGAGLYARHCAACHGVRMVNPEGATDLRKFPDDERERFINSVSKGRNSMPPWADLLTPDEIDALWAYVRAGENN